MLVLLTRWSLAMFSFLSIQFLIFDKKKKKIVPLRVWWLELLLKNKSDRPLMTNLSNISFKSKCRGGKVFLFVYKCMYGCLPV